MGYPYERAETSCNIVRLAASHRRGAGLGSQAEHHPSTGKVLRLCFRHHFRQAVIRLVNLGVQFLHALLGLRLLVTECPEPVSKS